MSLSPAAVRRYGRQIALPEIGAEGQLAFGDAEVALVGDGVSVDCAARYLTASGVGRLRFVTRADWPQQLGDWLESLRGASVVVRAGFEDDAMVRASLRLGIPTVVMRARREAVDLVAFRRHGPCPHGTRDFPVAASASIETEDDVAGALAGSLAATETLWILAHPADGPRARHLRLPLDGRNPTAAEIPWSPECFLCGGTSTEATFS